MSLARSPDPTVSHRWALLFLLAFLEGCVAMGSGRTKPEPRAGEILYRRGADLWIQSLDSGRHRALTSSGAVGGSVAISPNGKQVAYVEHGHRAAPGPGEGVAWGWDALFVVNADGTGRRKLVDLTQRPVPEGHYVRAGDFVWSDDGKSLAYVLESRPMKPPPRNIAHLLTSPTRDFPEFCEDATFHSVDVASGRGTSLFEARPLNNVTLLGWSPARAELAFHDECGIRKGEVPLPIPKGRVTLVRVSDRKMRQRYAVHPSMSPGGTFVFIPAQTDAYAPPSLYRTEDLGGPPAMTLTLPAGHEGRLTWLRHAPAALIRATELESPVQECVGINPQPRMLFWLELGTGNLRRVREDARALNVVAISPDGTYALIGIITGEDNSRFYPPCAGPRPVERLFLVRLDDLASDLPIEELVRRARPLTSPRPWKGVNPFAEYVGWVR
jgi:hypothetical protein